MNTLTLIPFVYERFNQFVPVFTRISALFSTFILFRSDYVNTKVIIGLSAMLSVLVLMLSTGTPLTLDLFSVQAIIVLAFQAFIGFIAGLILNIVFEIFTALGQIISTQIGLSLASLIDPKLGSITTVTQFYNFSIFIIFLMMDGHLYVIKTIMDSFAIIPVQQTFFSTDLMNNIVSYSGIMFSGSMLLAMAIIIAVMLTNLALSVISRFAPQFNLYSIGINLSLILGLICVYLTFGIFFEQAQTILQHGLEFFKNVIEGVK